MPHPRSQEAILASVAVPLRLVIRPALVASFALCSLGCEDSAPLRLADTEGRQLSARCQPGAGCEITAADGTAGRLVLRAAGRVMGVCPASARQWPHPECRALVCSSAAECPPAEGMERGSCVSGLCIEPAHPIIQEDSVLLCMAKTGVGQGTQAQIDHFAVGLQCGSPCVVPRICRQP